MKRSSFVDIPDYTGIYSCVFAQQSDSAALTMINI